MIESAQTWSLHLPFRWRQAECAVDVVVNRNVDPKAEGCTILDPAIPADSALGYPVCRAGGNTDLDAYAAAFGWIQLVRSSDDSDPTAFEVDPLALFRDIAMPFAFFGIKPLLFDAPFRAQRDDLQWMAHTFLCALPDGVMGNQVTPCVGFAWGFDVAHGAVTIREPLPLPLFVWDGYLELLRERYPAWAFCRAGDPGQV